MFPRSGKNIKQTSCPPSLRLKADVCNQYSQDRYLYTDFAAWAKSQDLHLLHRVVRVTLSMQSQHPQLSVIPIACHVRN
jgi:hypothetical protein